VAADDDDDDDDDLAPKKLAAMGGVLSKMDELRTKVTSLPKCDAATLVALAAPAGLHATLRSYQLDGMRWLVGMFESVCAARF